MLEGTKLRKNSDAISMLNPDAETAKGKEIRILAHSNKDRQKLENQPRAADLGFSTCRLKPRHSFPPSIRPHRRSVGKKRKGREGIGDGEVDRSGGGGGGEA
ncbi:hypothetical protein Tsubulata_045347 [Turnera subulata]|uniref:Uncharacterized protein n=1 Tax=Turnera subulata TaxID=218843 RepID=A0A9Q0FTC7_9ROSI|nr:hypothetical protein Tsubulata_045347 [Turnera subulata]